MLSEAIDTNVLQSPLHNLQKHTHNSGSLHIAMPSARAPPRLYSPLPETVRGWERH